MKLIKYILLIMAVFVLSCEEDDNPIAPSTKYHKKSIEPAGILRLFARSGEITSKNILSRYNKYDTIYFNRDVKNYRGQGFIDSISFLKNSVVVLNHNHSNTNYSMRSQGSILVLTEDKVNDQCCTFGEVLTRSLSYFIGQIKPDVYSEYISSSVRGAYYFGFTGKRKFVLQLKNKQLTAPFILFTKRYFDGINYYESRGFAQNLLQPDFFKELSVGDTVSLVEYQTKFEQE
jgi:hypothetical protein